MYTPEDQIYCLDNVPLNWSGIGKGDFRIPPAELVMPDGSFTYDFYMKDKRNFLGNTCGKGLPCAYAENR